MTRYRNTRTGRIVDLSPDEARAAGIPGRHRTPKKGPRWVEVVDEAPADAVRMDATVDLPDGRRATVHGEADVDDDGPEEKEPKPAEVRAWARAENIDVPPRGNLSTELVDQFKAAHPEEY